jgi:hypothetical protein
MAYWYEWRGLQNGFGNCASGALSTLTALWSTASSHVRVCVPNCPRVARLRAARGEVSAGAESHGLPWSV